METGIFITGTDTDAGKTVVSAVVLYLLRKSGINACYFKAALSGAVNIEGELIPCDARFVMGFAGINEEYEDIIPHIYSIPVSPHLAGRLEGSPVDRLKVLEKYNLLKKKYDFILVEGAGGVIVPLNDKGYMTTDLIQDLNIPVLICARAGVGTINHTSLSVEYIKNKNIDLRGIIFNGYDDKNVAHEDNVKMVESFNHERVLLKIPKFLDCDVEKNTYGNMRELCDALQRENLLEVLGYEELSR